MQRFYALKDIDWLLIRLLLFQVFLYQPGHRIKVVLLKVVVLVHSHQPTERESRTELFSNDLELSAAQIVDYYSLRFQIECDCRDAKKYLGLSSFRNYKQAQVTNVFNIGFIMCLLSKILLRRMREKYNCPGMRIAGMKVAYRPTRMLDQTIKFINTAPDLLSSPQNIARLAIFEAGHL